MQLCILFYRSVNIEADVVAELLLLLDIIKIIFSLIWRGNLLKKKKKHKTNKTKSTPKKHHQKL